MQQTIETSIDALSKKERKKLKRELERQKVDQGNKRSVIIKWIVIIIGIVLLIGGGWWVISESSKPLPGKTLESQGRDHVLKAKWEKFKYNSNPPTSGPHDAVWTTSGIYKNSQGDGHLVHSLEHGYIIISYNCTKLNSKLKTQNSKLDEFQISNFKFQISKSYAHEEGDTLTPEEHALKDTLVATDSGQARMTQESKECRDLQKQLTEIAKANKLWKLIVLPRPNMDTLIALTAWTKIETLQTVDSSEISRFINVYRDQGPEKTME